MLIFLIMASGSWERFWSLSTNQKIFNMHNFICLQYYVFGNFVAAYII